MTSTDRARIVERLRAATMGFDWRELPDDTLIPAIPLLREAASLIEQSASPALVGEPVAWRHRWQYPRPDPKGPTHTAWNTTDDKFVAEQRRLEGHEVIPLYLATPPSSPTLASGTVAGVSEDYELAETVHGEIVRIVRRNGSIKEPASRVPSSPTEEQLRKERDEARAAHKKSTHEAVRRIEALGREKSKLATELEASNARIAELENGLAKARKLIDHTSGGTALLLSELDVLLHKTEQTGGDGA
jgi:hypothetical protein